jgi:hypothetical protein
MRSFPRRRFSTLADADPQDGQLERPCRPSEGLQYVLRYLCQSIPPLIVTLVAYIKLGHAIAGVYMCVFGSIGRKTCVLTSRCDNTSWETVFTAGFELDVLRGKRPYRWTIWVSSFHHSRPRGHLNELAIPRNPLHRFIGLRLLLP